jgi:hypothetical protein
MEANILRCFRNCDSRDSNNKRQVTAGKTPTTRRNKLEKFRQVVGLRPCWEEVRKMYAYRYLHST